MEDTMIDKRIVEMKDDAADAAQKRADIIRNTPAGQDPVIYWHQVAMDAVHSSERDQARTRAAVEGRDRAEKDLDLFTKRLIDQAAREKERTPLDVSNLVRMARDGDISLNINISISGGREACCCED